MTRARLLIGIGAMLVLGAVNFSIFGKEEIKRTGEVIFLEVGQRDPRSLMQGDYMTLRFRLADDIVRSWGDVREGETHSVPIALDERRVATLAPQAGELKIRYRVRDHRAWIGTNAFFFEEGSDARYSAARFAEFRLDRATGEAVLVGLRDARLNAL